MGTRGKRPPTSLDSLANIDKELLREGCELVAQMREEMRQRELERQRIAAQEKRKKRKSFTKKERMAVYEKCDGHCAYCGCELELKDMQIDHIVPVGLSSYGDKESQRLIAEGKMNGIDNLLPACRQCNFYKGMGDLEEFRRCLKDVLWNTCTDTFQARLAMKYGMIVKHEWDEKFYFEKQLPTN